QVASPAALGEGAYGVGAGESQGGDVGDVRDHAGNPADLQQGGDEGLVAEGPDAAGGGVGAGAGPGDPDLPLAPAPHPKTMASPASSRMAVASEVPRSCAASKGEARAESSAEPSRRNRVLPSGVSASTTSCS